jgi:hypothetical protein
MEEKEQIIIPTSRKFIVLALLGSILFVVIGIFMVNSEPTRKYSSTFLQTWGVIGIAFFGLTTMYCLRKLLDTKPGLIVDENGIWNNSSIISNHTIQWSELKGTSLKKIGNEKILFLYFKDDKGFVLKFNFIERFLMRLNLSLYNSPIGISTRSLKYDVEKLNRQIQYRIKNCA